MGLSASYAGRRQAGLRVMCEEKTLHIRENMDGLPELVTLFALGRTYRVVSERHGPTKVSILPGVNIKRSQLAVVTPWLGRKWPVLLARVGIG